ncbi:hypothetical protein CU098_005245, partial [Rhizopus stolonifer]
CCFRQWSSPQHQRTLCINLRNNWTIHYTKLSCYYFYKCELSSNATNSIKPTVQKNQKIEKKSFFMEDKQTPVPTHLNKRKFIEESSQSEFAKRTKRQHNNDPAHLTFFDKSMHNYISIAILNKMKNSKRLDPNLLKVKNDSTRQCFQWNYGKCCIFCCSRA